MVYLIARAALFGNPAPAQARCSRAGRHILFVAPDERVLNACLAHFADLRRSSEAA
jgi:hypothetical protein